MSKKLAKKINQLKKLVQYKNYSKEALEEVARKSLENEEIYKSEWSGFDSAEAKKANELLKIYINKYHIIKFSDREDLKTLIENEILKQRIQKRVGDDAGIPPKYVIDSLNTLQNQILNLKEKLGIFEDKKQTDSLVYIQKLKKKFKKWQEENQGSRTCICPHCSKMIMLKIRTEAWEEQKHPFFKDRILANEHLVKLYQEKKIIKEDVAKILGCSTDYVGWLIKKFPLQK